MYSGKGIGGKGYYSARRDTRSRTSISNLPVELHSRIAQLCYDQDRNYKRYRAALDNLEDPPEELEVLKERQDEMYGKSLQALHCVSKHWSDMAAPFLFETLSAKKASLPIFRFSIASKRLNCFSRIHLDSASMDDLVNILSLASRLPRLHTVSANGVYIADVLKAPSNVTTTEETETARYWALRTLQDISPQITTLQIWESSATTLRRLCRLFPKTTTLDFRDLSSLEEGHDPTRRLFLEMSKMAHLKTIRIDVPDDVLMSTSLPDDLVWPSIESLTLRLHSFQSLGFLTQLPATLRVLNIEYTSKHPTSLPPCNLPSLQSLTYVGKYSAPFFVSLPSSFPSLVDLNLQISEWDAEVFQTAIDLPNLRRFTFHDPGYPLLSSRAYESHYTDILSKGVEVDTATDVLQNRLILAGNKEVREIPGGKWGPQRQLLFNEVDRTMESLIRLHDEAKTTQKRALYDKLADLLRAAAMERLAQEF